MNRIEPGAESAISTELRMLIQAGNPLLVSGQPLRMYHPEDKAQDSFLLDCRPLQEEAFLPPFRLFTQIIPASQRTHIAPEFNTDADVKDRAEYPAIQGFLIDGSEVVMGIRDALGFYAKPYQPEE